MAYFSPEFLKFFSSLEKNNSKEWFDEHRKDYEKFVKKPFKSFIEELIINIQYRDPKITLEAKNAIFRINRDIRFSKDKTPYKTKSSAIICRGPKKTHMKPGIYIEMSPLDFRIYGGIYALETADLKKVREEISYNTDEFDKLLNNKSFTSLFGSLHGEQNKRIPKEFAKIASTTPLIANKQFYFYTKMPANTIEQDNLMDIILEHYDAGKPLLDFLERNLE